MKIELNKKIFFENTNKICKDVAKLCKQRQKFMLESDY